MESSDEDRDVSEGDRWWSWRLERARFRLELCRRCSLRLLVGWSLRLGECELVSPSSDDSWSGLLLVSVLAGAGVVADWRIPRSARVRAPSGALAREGARLRVRLFSGDGGDRLLFESWPLAVFLRVGFREGAGRVDVLDLADVAPVRSRLGRFGAGRRVSLPPSLVDGAATLPSRCRRVWARSSLSTVASSDSVELELASCVLARSWRWV